MGVLFTQYKKVRSKFMQKQNIVILGATGSIGQSTLSVIEHNPENIMPLLLLVGKTLSQCLKNV
ncbi:1-deoxy-D-xylulose 5-phosphate reductoisomerase [Rodentibacter pneumotropicus]|uniref:1-deoxy-D-xylulose 5-phosphate reductoisomerase n=1 Tax=Rodentibacter pneumotropicus TaxID=758 RepID=A0A3S4Y4J4_9PAST|nr:1-deoxy-D-xylulose 5-phosphate reductoisomerase [Rodentibacter pneumotropicus]